MSEETKKKTASERIKNLEETLVGTLKAMNGINQEKDTLKQALILLANKVDAIVKLLNASQELSDSNISNIIVQNKADELANNTNQLVKNGILKPSDTVANDSFVVGREVMDDGNVVNPRIQFTVESAQEPLKAKLVGSKVLDKILIEEGKAKLELLEIYSIHEPSAPSAASDEEASPAADAQA